MTHPLVLFSLAYVLAAPALAQGPRPATPAKPPAAAASVAVPRTQFIATMDGEFRKMDADHNNILTRKEVEDFQRAMSGFEVDNRRRALFAALDANHDGSLTTQEFAGLKLSAAPINAARVIGPNDVNRDGQVTLVEFRTAKLHNFDNMDTDKDGVVSPVEMKAAGLIK